MMGGGGAADGLTYPDHSLGNMYVRVVGLIGAKVDLAKVKVSDIA